MITPFIKGNPATVRKLNELITVVNNLMRSTGDGFVNVQHGTNGGLAISLSMNELRARFRNMGGGGGGGGDRVAYCVDDAGSGEDIDVFLDDDGTGEQVTATCLIANGSDLDEALPHLNDGDPMIVAKIDGTWYSTTLFNGAVVRA